MKRDDGTTTGLEGRYDRPIFGSERDETRSRSRRRRGAPAGVPRSTAPTRRRPGLQVQLLVFSVLALLVVVGGAWLYLRPVEQAVVLDSYQYATVGTRDFRELIVGSGRVEPETVTVFVAPVDAEVVEIFVEVGADAAAGEPLLRLASEQLLEDVDKAVRDLEDATLDLEQARLKTAGDLLAHQRELGDAQAALAAAEAELPLIRELYELGGVSNREWEQAVAEVEGLERRVDDAVQALALVEAQVELTRRQAEQKARGAERALAKLQEQLDKLTLRADTDGRVLSLDVRAGQRVAAGSELLRHADIRRQEVHTAVTPEQAASLFPGAPARLRTGGRDMPAAVGFVAPSARTRDDRSAVPVTLVLNPEDAATLRPFTDVTFEVELGVRRDRPALARGPFFASGDASFVYVLSEDGRRAERREVRYGALDGSFVEIAAGLEPGDQIVYSSYTAFRTHPTVELIREGGRPVE